MMPVEVKVKDIMSACEATIMPGCVMVCGIRLMFWKPAKKNS